MSAAGSALAAWYTANSNLINTIGLNAVLALSVYVMLACGQLSLASPAYMAVGAYTAALLTTNGSWPFAAQIVVGTVLAGLVALLLGLPLLRLRGVYLAIATVGFVAVVQVFFTNWTPGGGGAGTPFIPAATTTWQIYLVLVLLCYVFWRLEGSALGRNFAAIRQDEEAARSLGIDTVAHKLGAFATSGLIAGLAGVLYARLHFFIDPPTFSIGVGLDALVYVIVGGSLTFLGSPLGAFLITTLPEVLRFLQGARAVVDGLIVLAVILFLPGGLVELPERLLRLARGLRPPLAPGYPRSGSAASGGHRG
jgi:branched-chain amino acid transport system permease protein